MKRYGYLFEKVADIENCKQAIIEASKHKRNRSYVIKILSNIDYYANDLSKRIIENRITSPYRIKIIKDGLSHKEREIKIPRFYPDQCVHHALIRVLSPIILKSSYKFSCANIRNRGIDYASKYVNKCICKHKVKYCCKLDISKFYPSIKNSNLKMFLRTKLKDEKLLKMLDAIIDTSDGLPIGNYTSPWLAEWYFQRVDHFVKKIKAPYYCRYADDMVLMGNNKKRLHNIMMKVINFIKENLDLTIKGNYQLFPVVKRKIDFLGRCFGFSSIKKCGYITIRKRRALAIMKKSRLIQKLINKGLSIKYYLASGFISRISIFKHTNSYKMKCKYQYCISLKNLKDVIRSRNETNRSIERVYSFN